MTSFADVASVVQKHFGPEIVRSITAGLSVIASLTFKNRPHCLALIFVGPSGTGKSVSVEAFMHSNDNETKNYLYRADNFTPASFVSHSANQNEERLKKIDMLPRIKNKTMLTKELSPLFRSDVKEMRKNFSVLTPVLDGKGYVSDSGAHGQRGYEGEHMFNWLGATTPFEDSTYDLMAQLGNRLLFYEMGLEASPSEEDLIAFAKKCEGTTGLTEVQNIVNQFIKDFFNDHPVNTLELEGIRMNHEVLRSIVRYANLVTKGRVAIQKNDGDSNLEAEAAEAPQRIIKSLQMISAAIALIHGRFEVDSEDLRIIRHIAFSSLPERRRKALRALLASGGILTVTQAESELNISRPTALNYMKELAATGIVDFHPGDQAKNVPGKITLQQKWQWLIDDQTSTDPLNESDVRALEDKKEKEIETNVRPSQVYFKGVFDPSVDCESEQLALAEAWEIESSFHYWTIEEILEVGHA